MSATIIIDTAPLASARGCHDQRMREGFRDKEGALRFRGTELAEKEAAAGLGEEAVALHLAPGLPMRRAEARQGIAEKRDTQHQRGDPKAREDQVHPEEVPRRAGAKSAVLPRKQGDVECIGRQPIADGQKARGHDVADGKADQRQAQDAGRDLPLIHG